MKRKIRFNLGFVNTYRCFFFLAIILFCGLFTKNFYTLQYPGGHRQRQPGDVAGAGLYHLPHSRAHGPDRHAYVYPGGPAVPGPACKKRPVLGTGHPGGHPGRRGDRHDQRDPDRPVHDPLLHRDPGHAVRAQRFHVHLHRRRGDVHRQGLRLQRAAERQRGLPALLPVLPDHHGGGVCGMDLPAFHPHRPQHLHGGRKPGDRLAGGDSQQDRHYPGLRHLLHLLRPGGALNGIYSGAASITMGRRASVP